MVAAGRLVGLARAGAASQPGSDGGRTDEQEEIPPLDRHPDTLPRVWRASHPTCPRPSDDGRRAQSTGGAVGGQAFACRGKDRVGLTDAAAQWVSAEHVRPEIVFYTGCNVKCSDQQRCGKPRPAWPRAMAGTPAHSHARELDRRTELPGLGEQPGRRPVGARFLHRRVAQGRRGRAQPGSPVHRSAFSFIRARLPPPSNSIDRPMVGLSKLDRQLVSPPPDPGGGIRGRNRWSTKWNASTGLAVKCTQRSTRRLGPSQPAGRPPPRPARPSG